MKQTLLQIVQGILSSMSSDEISALGDSTESLQVANIVRDTYFNIINRADLPDQCELFQLVPFTDSSKPVVMLRPDNVSRVDWIKYFNTNVSGSQFNAQFGAYSHGLNLDIVTTQWSTNSTTINTASIGLKTWTVASSTLPIVIGQTTAAVSGNVVLQGNVVSYIGTTLTVNVTSIAGSGTFSAWVISSTTGVAAVPGYQYVTILPVRQFVDMVNTFNPTDNNVNSFPFTVNEQSFTFYYKTDHQPQYCTVLENLYIIFDSYDKTQDGTLQASKTECYGQLIPTFLMQDNFIPELDAKQFQLLVNEAKSLAFYELKQQMHQKAEQESRRQWVNVEKTKSLTNRPIYFNQLPNFGRRSGTGGYSGRRYGPQFYGNEFTGQ